MRHFVLAIFAAFVLSACGGGGGGNAPSVVPPAMTPPGDGGDNDDAGDQEARAQLEAEMRALRDQASGVEGGDALRRQLNDLINKIADAHRTIEDLRASLASLRRSLEDLRARPPAMTMTMAMPTPEPAPTCGANEVLRGGVCVCEDGYQRSGDICEKVTPPQPACTDFRVRNADGECTYNTPEFRENYALERIGALYAYEQGFHGQGVTVALGDAGTPRLSHIELIGQVVNSLHTGRTHSTDATQNSWHATATGGLIAALRNGRNAHGVAPEAKLVSFFTGGSHRRRLQYYVDNTLNLVSSQSGFPSLGFRSGQIRGMRYGTQLGLYQRQFNRMPSIFPFSARVAEWRLLENSDIVRVQSAGNHGWQGAHSTTYLGLCASQDPDDDCELPRGTPILTLSIGELLEDFVDEIYGEIRTLNISPFGCDLYCFFPEENPLLEDNWLVVTALDKDDAIASFSNTCGDAKDWCISAHGVGTSTPHGGFDDRNSEGFDGTSFSTPHVSGALAVLKSAANDLIAPSFPMTMVRQVLLESATDLGDAGVDEVYGWGLVNISAGVVSIQNMAAADGTSVSELRRGLPAGLSHLRGRLSGVSVALRITDRSYWNAPLSSLLGGVGDSVSSSGTRVREVMSDEFRAGESFRFWGGLDYDGGASRFIGEGDGIFGASGASDASGYVSWSTADYGGFSAFGEYGYTAIEAEYGGSSWIAGLDSARAEEWTAGLQFGDVFRYGDLLRLSARQESRLSGGEMVLRHLVAEGDSHEAFIGESSQTIQMQESRIPISEDRTMVYGIGYGREEDGIGWNAAAEWNSRSGAAAFWAELEMEF